MSKADIDKAARAIEDFLSAVGASAETDPELVGTGRRVAEAFAFDLLAGYAMDPSEILRETMPSSTSGMVVVSGIATTIVCPHHLMPGVGVVHVGYSPSERVVGFGAIGRLIDCFSRRLTLQETFGQAVADALVAEIGARGAACYVDMEPTCFTARGEKRHGARVVTSAYAGTFINDASARQEFIALIGSRATNDGTSAR